MLKWLIALALLSAAAQAQTIWTWVDEEGRRHYSDRPVEGATQIQVAAPQTFEGATPAPAASPSGPAAGTEAFTYTTFEIISPEAGQTLTNIGSNLSVEIATFPALQPAHSIELDYDGTRLPLSTRSLSITVTDVFRGEHTLAAVIVGPDGTQLARSAPVTFFVQQESTLAPSPQTVAPARPAGTPPPRPQPRGD